MFKKIKEKFNSLCTRTAVAVMNIKAEGYVDSGVKILIAVVIGALFLGLLYTLMETTIMTSVTTKVQEMFNYAG